MPSVRVSQQPPAETDLVSTTPPVEDDQVIKEDRSALETVLYNLHHDPLWLKEVSLGKRVGFYKFRGELGQGNFSTVKLAYHQLTKDKVAIKVIDKAKLDHKTQKMLNREIENMDAVTHPNIIRLFEVVETYSRIHLVMEYAPGGELFNKVSTEGRVYDREAAGIFGQVLSAIIYLHSISIIHRDIKAENVFVAENRKVKLGDFGFSTRVQFLGDPLATFCGSPPYAAPELYKDESYQGPGVDIWALGVLLFFLLTADMPFKAATVAALKRQILSGAFTLPPWITEKAKDLINSLMVRDPAGRLTVKEISSHPWLQNENISIVDTIQPLPSYVSEPRKELLTLRRTINNNTAVTDLKTDNLVHPSQVEEVDDVFKVKLLSSGRRSVSNQKGEGEYVKRASLVVPTTPDNAFLQQLPNSTSHKIDAASINNVNLDQVDPRTRVSYSNIGNTPPNTAFSSETSNGREVANASKTEVKSLRRNTNDAESVANTDNRIEANSSQDRVNVIITPKTNITNVQTNNFGPTTDVAVTDTLQIDVQPMSRKPSISYSETSATEAEISAIDMLTDWGITPSALKESSSLGVRSPLVATYRMLVQKQLRVVEQKRKIEVEDNLHRSVGISTMSSMEQLSSAKSRLSLLKKFCYCFSCLKGEHDEKVGCALI